MAGVTDEGWVGKSLQQLLDELGVRAKEEFGEEFPTTPDSVFTQFANPFMASTKDLWDLGQAATDAQNRDAATGIYLDYLANLIGLSRIPASGSTGDLAFTGDVAAVVPAFFPCSDTLNRNVLTQDELTLNRTACWQSTFSIAAVIPSTDYTITVGGADFTYTSGVGDGATEILNGLALLMQSDDSFTEVVNEEDSTLQLTWSEAENSLATLNSPTISLDNVAGLVKATAAETGSLDFPADTIVNLGSSTLTVDSVTNPFDFSLGRAEETDEELRIRMALREQSTGTATKPAIEASLSEVEGVTSVYVEENITLNDDLITGVPAKSYEAFVSGGNTEDIAEVVWLTKPAGIATHGDITESVIDRNGDTQTVKFSRPTKRYAWLRATYTVNVEEAFPADGEQAMKDAVIAYGNNLSRGEDYEPTKFYAPLYTVQGIYVENIEIAVTDDPMDTPAYQTVRIPVSVVQTLSFTDTRVVVQT